MNYPYQRGDVLWYMADGPDTVQPGLTIQDSVGDYAKWLIGALPDYLGPDGASLERHAARAELPIIAPHPNFSLTDGGPENPLDDAYSYLSAVRPGLTVRQFVEGAENGGLSLYWDMNDPYNQQIGSGLTGDLPGDYVFLFGGAVIRSEQAGIAESAIYGASAFVTDERDTKGARVLPPYWGEAGAADSGPLMTLHGQPIEMFFHPTSLRPGMILEQGDTLALAGQIAPTLASKIHVTITSPSAEIHDFSGKANAIGYYYDPANDFVVDEPGIWTVQIDVWHSGQTSAGPVHEPYPHGSVLGSTDGRFSIYVVPPGNPLLEWNDTRQDFSIPGAIPYNFNFRIPSGWTNVRVDHTLTSPGFILQLGPLPISGASFTFQHNPDQSQRGFPQSGG